MSMSSLFIKLFWRLVMKRLKELRISKKMTLQQMADILGLTQRNYQRYETGEVDPPTSKTIALADYFNVSLDFLTGRSDCPDILNYDKDGNPVIIEMMSTNKEKSE